MAWIDSGHPLRLEIHEAKRVERAAVALPLSVWNSQTRILISNQSGGRQNGRFPNRPYDGPAKKKNELAVSAPHNFRSFPN